MSFDEFFDSLLEILLNLWRIDGFRNIVYLIIFVKLLFSIPSIYRYIRAVRRKRKIRRMFSGQDTITPDAFLKMRKVGNRLNPVFNVPGVYVLHNTSKNMHYVGQGKSVSKRVFNHFNGSGNGDVYADYKYNDNFTIQIMPLANSGYADLDALERHAIEAHSSYTKGYNRNRGNGWKSA